jgi:2-dehydropantoate 2-reductase
MSKILVFGTGGVGSIYAYICEKGGATVTAVCRGNYSAVKEHGITIDSKIFGKVHGTPTPVRTVLEAVSNGPFDYIIVASKAFPGTSALIKDAVTPNHTSIVLAQNGIGIEQEYHSAYPTNTIISGVVYLPTTQTRPGYVEMGPLELFEIGVFPTPSNPPKTGETNAVTNAQHFSDIFRQGGATCTVHSDIQKPRWIKLSVNAAWNPLCALTLCDDANLLRSSPGAIEQIKSLMKEVADVATAVGYEGLVTDVEIDGQLSRAWTREYYLSFA